MGSSSITYGGFQAVGHHAFHHEMPPLAQRMPIPRALHDQGIRRYGFHGLSYKYIARQLARVDPALAQGRVIAAHLGNGASMCAMHAGRSVDTTMGFTALDGLMMGTRCGSIDPGAVLHFQTQLHMRAGEVEHLLYRESGLLGVSGISSVMLGGLDGFVFTAGIGENHADVRTRICRRLEWLGVDIDEVASAANSPQIALPSSKVAVRVIPTDEERMIASHTITAMEHAT